MAQDMIGLQCTYCTYTTTRPFVRMLVGQQTEPDFDQLIRLNQREGMTDSAGHKVIVCDNGTGVSLHQLGV